MTRLLVLLALLIALAAPAAAPATEGNFLVDCPFTHANNDDLIVLPGQPGAAHGHAYFAVPGIGAATVQQDLLLGPPGGAPETSCQVQGERVGFWTPYAIKADGTPVYPFTTAIYYRNANVEAGPAYPFPMGIRHVHGNAHNRNPNTYAAVYRCTNPSSGTTVTIPTSCNGTIEETMFFANCWDGESTNPPDHKPLKACDAAHRIKLPAINAIIKWPKELAGVGTKLTSDIDEGVAGGLTSHADYDFGADPFMFAKVVERCLNAGIQCRTSNGNGPPAGSIYQFGTQNVILTAAEARGL